jgi:hypothetical protein
MKADTATACFIDRVRQQMVKVHEHSSDEYQVRFLPGRPVKQVSNYYREYKMEEIMKCLLHYQVASKLKNRKEHVKLRDI